MVVILPLQEFLEDTSEGVAGPAHTDVLSQSQIFHLVFDTAFLPVARLFGLVGLDAPNIVWGAFH